MRYWNAFLSVGGAFVVMGMSCPKGPPPPDPVRVTPILSVDRVYYDDTGGFQDSTRITIKDEATFRDSWRRATSGQPSPPLLPAVDFTHYMLLLVAAGPQAPGDRIRVDSVATQGNRYYAWVTLLLQCQDFPTRVYPVEIVKVGRSETPVEFRYERQQAPSCQ